MSLSSIGLRTRLVVLVLLAVIPAFALNTYTAIQERQRAAQNAEADASNIVRMAVREQSRLVTASKQLLHSLALLQEVKDRQTAAACSRVFSELVRPYPFYTSLGVATLDGNVWCTSRAFTGKVNISDRVYFRRTLESKDFSVGNYIFGRVTFKHALNMGYPIIVANELKGIMYAGIDLSWVSQMISAIHLPRDSMVAVVDSEGTVLANYPDSEGTIGKQMSDTELMRVLLKSRQDGVTEIVGSDGVPRFVAYASLQGTSGGNVYVAVGLSKPVAFAAADAQFVRNLLLLLVIAVLALSIAWIGSDVFVLQRIKAFTAAAQRLGKGDLTARTGLSHSAEELGQLAAVFDNMAGALQQLNEELEDRIALRTRQLVQANEQLKHRTLLDPLTGIPNRLLFNDRLSQHLVKAGESSEIVAVAAIDFNDFKSINDTYGHYAGDLVLKEAAERMVKSLPINATVARLGGDRFSIVVNADNKERALELLESLHTTLTTLPVNIGRQFYSARASMSVAFFPDHAHTYHDLMHCADVAMHRAKHSSEKLSVYSPEIDDDVGMSIVADIRGAIERSEITLYCQPKYDYATDKVIGVEGLARWEHPKLGVIKPMIFLPIVENTGLNKVLTTHLVSIALKQAARWRAQGIELTISVKIDNESLTDPIFAGFIADQLSKNAIPGRVLDLGIQESGLAINPARASETLSELHKQGVSITIEDFGTGYDSLAWIPNTVSSISRIKISRRYVMDMPTNEQCVTYVQSLINMAHALKLKVVAEGVESETTWDELKTLGCDYAQGYYISRPVKAGDLAEWYFDYIHERQSRIS